MNPRCSQCSRELSLRQDVYTAGTGMAFYQGWACGTCKRLFCDSCHEKWHSGTYGFCPACHDLLKQVVTQNGVVQWNL